MNLFKILFIFTIFITSMFSSERNYEQSYEIIKNKDEISFIRTFKNNQFENKKLIVKYPNGNLKKIEYYTNGKLHGKSFYYDRNGILKEKLVFTNGKLIQSI